MCVNDGRLLPGTLGNMTEFALWYYTSAALAWYHDISDTASCCCFVSTSNDRISPTVEDANVDQAGFRRGRSTCDQVTALTTFTKNGVEKTLKSGADFLDLTAAYDTIWHTDLIYKLSKCLPLWCVQTVELLLWNRRFRVHMGENVSSWRRQANGLPGALS